MTATEDLELAQQLADIADGISLRYFAAGAVPTQTKADGSPVTPADREVEQAIRDRLATSRPDDLVIGEELGSHGTASRQWIVDPIDGTANFSAGRPEWSTLLAVQVHGEIVTGMVSAPALRQRWWATRSAGAWTSRSSDDGDPQRREPLVVSSIAELDKATVAIWPLSAWVPPQYAAAGRRLVELGADGGPLSDWAGVCHGAMLVAAGVADVFFHMSAGPWDIAAAVPIVEEAGGMVSDLGGGRSISAKAAVYSNGRVHREVLDELQRAIG
ncbi:histidinol-phosphatase [Catenulispora sp. MAP12-49]|uniref:inositol monophosphatase family protein n=1 Tax=unclassified Catenulispora TaxID=414885 RepID=UPI003514BA07